MLPVTGPRPTGGILSAERKNACWMNRFKIGSLQRSQLHIHEHIFGVPWLVAKQVNLLLSSNAVIMPNCMSGWLSSVHACLGSCRLDTADMKVLDGTWYLPNSGKPGFFSFRDFHCNLLNQCRLLSEASLTHKDPIVPTQSMSVPLLRVAPCCEAPCAQAHLRAAQHS